MSQINPFIGSILQTPNAQRQAAADRDRLRRAGDSAKNAYMTEDRLELSIESTDKSEQAGDDSKRREQPEKRPKKNKPDESDERLDIKA